MVMLILGSALAINSVNVSGLEVEPYWVEITGQHGTWVNKTITIYNDENSTVNVTIDPSSALSDIYISHPLLSLGPYQKKNITIGMQMKDAHGYITYSWEGEQFNQFILLTPVMGNVTVAMLNERPEPGDVVGFMLTPPVTGTGSIYVPETGNIHPFSSFMFGMAFARLDKEDYGTAVAVFSGETFFARASFTIEGVAEKNVVLSAPDSVDIDSRHSVTLTLNGNPVSGAEIDVTEPDGDSYIKITDSDGVINITFDKKGTWLFNATYNGVDANAEVQVVGGGGNHNNDNNTVSVTISVPGEVFVGEKKWVTLFADNVPVPSEQITVQQPSGGIFQFTTNQMGQIYYDFDEVGKYRFTANHEGASDIKEVTAKKATMNITVPQSGTVGQYVTIGVDPGSSITIKGGVQTITTTTASGEYSFKPDRKGTYTVSAETSTKKGSATFKIYEHPSISVFDIDHNRVNEVVVGKQYQIIITDSNGDTIQSIDTIQVKSPSGWADTLQMVDGAVIWSPSSTGTHVIETDEGNLYTSASMSITAVSSGGGGLSFSNTYLMILLVIVVIVLFVAGKKRREIQDFIGKIRKGKKEKDERDDTE